MMTNVDWSAWQIDGPTAMWALWLAWFAAQESVAIYTTLPMDTLTAHLRPVFQATPIAWFLVLGLWLWLGWHFLIEGIFVGPTGTG